MKTILKTLAVILITTTLFSCTPDDNIKTEEWVLEQEKELTLPFEQNDSVYGDENFCNSLSTFRLFKFISGNKLVIAKVENNVVLPSYLYDIDYATKKITYIVEVHGNNRQNIGEKQEYKYFLLNSSRKVLITKFIYKEGKGVNKAVAKLIY